MNPNDPYGFNANYQPLSARNRFVIPSYNDFPPAPAYSGQLIFPSGVQRSFLELQPQPQPQPGPSPSPSPSSVPRCAETRYLVSVWREYHPISKRKNSSEWEMLSIEVNQILKEQGINNVRSATQCKSRIKNLEDEYKRVKDHNGRSGNNRETSPYYEDLDEILGSRPKITPKKVIECGFQKKDSDDSEVHNSSPSSVSSNQSFADDIDESDVPIDKPKAGGKRKATASKQRAKKDKRVNVGDGDSPSTSDFFAFLSESQARDHEFMGKLAEKEDKIVTITTKADVVFVMDSSGSISKDDYNKEKEFVRELANIFDISQGQARASVIIYDDNPKLIFGFEDELDNRNVSAAIQSLEHLNGRTRIDKALAVAEKVFTGARPTVPRLAFILTDGKQTEEFDAKPLDVASKPLKDLGVKIYVIGVGAHVNPTELNLLAEGPEDVFTVASFGDLLLRLREIIQHADQPDSAKPVNLTADLLFLVDSSWSVTQDEFKKEKKLVNNLAKAFKVSPDYTRAGAIVYSDSAKLNIPFGKHSNIKSFGVDVDGLPYVGGRKRIENALQLASDTFDDARPQVPKIAIVLTKGNELTDPGSYALENAIRSLRERNVHVFVIGVGDSLNINALVNMVSNNIKNVITERSFDRLNHYAPSVARYIAKHTDISTPLDPSTDVVFLIDSSKTVGESNYRRLKEFVITLAKSFKPTQNGPRIGTVVFSRNAYTVNNLPDFTDHHDFTERLVRAGFLRKSRRIDRAIERTGEMFEDDNRGGPKIGILVTSGPNAQERGSIPLNQAMKKMRDLGGKMYSIAIGPDVSESEMGSISHPNNIIKIPDFRSLQANVQKVGLHISRTYGKQDQQSARDYDVVFVIDSTSEVSPRNYRVQKEYVKSLARSLVLASDTTRASLIIYGNFAIVKSSLGDFQTLQKFEQKVDGVEHLGGQRRIDKALERAATVLAHGRPGAQKLAILLTAGRQTRNGAKSLNDAVRPLRSIGAKTYIVAIGDRVNTGELRPAVQRPDDVMRVPSFAVLSRHGQDAINHVLGITGAPKDFEADILFLIDSSNDITSRDFANQKDFVKYIANLLNIKSGKSRAAVVNYGDKPTIVSRFDGYQSFIDLRKQIDEARPVGGGRRVDSAFNIVPDIFNNARRHVPKVVVLVNGGKQVPGARGLGESVKQIRNIGAKTFVVAAGPNVDYSQLRPAVENQRDLAIVPLFGKLRHTAPGLTKYIAARISNHCHYAQPRAKPTISFTSTDSPKPENFKADVVFMVDSSRSISSSDFQKQKEFIKTIAKSLNIFPGQSRAAVVSYGSTSTPAVRFGSYNTIDELHASIDAARSQGGPRRIDQALDGALAQLRQARPNVPRIVILVTGGRHTTVLGGKDLDVAAKSISDHGAKTYVVGVGNGVDKDELRPLVLSPSDVVEVDSFDSLPLKGLEIGRTIISRSGAPPSFSCDVIFLVDASTGVSHPDFVTQKLFVKQLARLLNVQPGSSRAALVTYSKNPSIVFSFNDYTSMENFDQSVDRAPYLGGTRRIDNALKTAAQLVQQARSDVPKLVVLLTAGRQGPGATSVSEAVKPLNKLGARTFIVALGPNPDPRQLLPAVTSSSDLTVVKSYADLRPQAPPLSRHMASESESCNAAADIAFVVDSSGSIGPKDYETMKSFVSAMAKKFRLSLTGSRAAVIQYSSIAVKEIDFNTFKNTDDFSKAVQALVQQRGQTRIDKALKLTYNELFGPRGSSRKFVKRIAFVLTDGRQTPDPDAVDLDVASEQLRRANVYVIAVGIGHNVDRAELRLMTERDDDVYLTKSFEELISKVGTFSKTACKAKPTDLTADVVFLMDSSRQVTRSTFKGEKNLVKNLAKLLNISPGKSRGAVITYGSTPRRVITFDQYRSLPTFENAIDNAPSIGGNRRMDKALEAAASVLAGGRPSSPKIAVLLTTGNQVPAADDKTFDVGTYLLGQLGAKTYVVAVGQEPSRRELLGIVSKPSEILSVPGFDNIIQHLRPISQEIAQAGASPSFVADIIFLIDTSRGVTPSQFTREKSFIKQLSKQLNVRPGYSRAALVPYGNTADVGLRFESYSTSAEYESAIDNLRTVGGPRRADKALATAAQLVPDGRRDVPKIVVLLTAGEQDSQALPLSRAVVPVSSLGAHTYVIGVGPDKDVNKLKAAVRPGAFIDIPSFSHLVENAPGVARQISSGTPTCTVPVDLAFIVDSSGSIGQSNYTKIKTFVSALASTFGISRDGSRAAVILYSDYASVEINFGDHDNIDEFKKKVDSLPHQRGRTRIDRALQLAHVKLFGPGGSARHGVHRIVVLLTDGQQTKDPDSVALDKAAAVLRREGAYIFTVGIGSHVSRDELRLMTEKDGDVVMAPSFDDLLGKVGAFAKTTCDEPQAPTTADLDIVFAVDSSSSVKKSDFDQEKDFIKKVARTLNVEPGKSRAALITYGNNPKRVFMFDSHGSLSQFDTKVDEATQQGGQRRIDKVLEEAAQIFNQSSRPGISKLLVLLTGGGQYPDLDARNLGEAARPLYDLGTKMYVVNIGSRPDIDELRRMVERPEDLIPVKSFDILPLLSSAIAREMASGAMIEKCDVPVDIVFIVDSSGSIRIRDYRKVRSFIARLASNFHISPTTTRLGLILYSNDAKNEINFGDFPDVSSFSTAVAALPHQRGKTRIDRALLLAYKDFFGPQGTARRGVLHIAIVMTDGRQTMTPDVVPLDRASEPLKRAGVYIVAVGIGLDAKREELRLMTAADEDVIMLQSFDALIRKVKSFAKTACEAPSVSLLDGDIIFLMDSSSPVGTREYLKEKEFVKSLAKSLKVGPGHSRAALITYGSRASRVVNFDGTNTLKDFEFAVDSAGKVGGPRRIDSALDTAATMLDESRPNVPKIVVLMTAGRTSLTGAYKALDAAAKPLRDRGAKTYVVAIGAEPNQNELLPVVESPRDIFRIQSFDLLPIEMPSTARRIGDQTGAPPNFGADIVFLADSSADISEADFTRQKYLVKLMADLLNVQSRQSRAAFVTYGDHASVVTSFVGYASLAEFNRLVDNAAAIKGTRRMDVGMETATKLMLQARHRVPRIVVLFTGGVDGIKAKPLQMSVQKMKDMGIRSYVIAFGTKPDLDTLRPAVDKPENLLYYPESRNLRPKGSETARHIANTSPVCSTPVDIAFIVDSSGSITSADYTKIKQFIAQMASKFHISPTGSRIAVILYSDDADTEIDFGSYSHYLAFRDAALRLPHHKGLTRIDRALQLAYKDLFGPSGSSRRGVQKVAVVLTDGKQTTAFDAVALDKASKPLWESDVDVIAIGIGAAVDRKELRLMTKRDQDVFLTKNVNDLLVQLGDFSLSACNPVKKTTDTNADIIFLMDSSYLVGAQDYETEKNFVRSLARYLNVTPGQSRAAVVTYGGIAQRVMGFLDYKSVPDFEELLRNAPSVGGVRRIDSALKSATALLRDTRADAKKIVILFTAGQQARHEDSKALDVATQPLRDAGAKTFVISIGSEPKDKELRQIVEDPRDIFKVGSFDVLYPRAYPVAREISRAPGRQFTK
ncbi:hypothetical protein QZH41_005840 [Actinostola sp. cb2023]|nr:hypothetical protein QZH41_005840 [Actinostola sp. cb2023]